VRAAPATRQRRLEDLIDAARQKATGAAGARHDSLFVLALSLHCIARSPDLTADERASVDAEGITRTVAEQLGLLGEGREREVERLIGDAECVAEKKKPHRLRWPPPRRRRPPPPKAWSIAWKKRTPLTALAEGYHPEDLEERAGMLAAELLPVSHKREAGAQTEGARRAPELSGDPYPTPLYPGARLLLWEELTRRFDDRTPRTEDRPPRFEDLADLVAIVPELPEAPDGWTGELLAAPAWTPDGKLCGLRGIRLPADPETPWRRGPARRLGPWGACPGLLAAPGLGLPLLRGTPPDRLRGVLVAGSLPEWLRRLLDPKAQYLAVIGALRGDLPALLQAADTWPAALPLAAFSALADKLRSALPGRSVHTLPEDQA